MEIMYYIIVVICNLINVYTLYRFYNYIFNKEKINQKIELFTFGIFWIVNTSVYCLINIPIITLLTNLISYYLLTFNYQGSQKKKIFSAVFFCFAMLFVECIIVFVTAKVPFNILEQNQYYAIFGQIFISIFAYLFIEILIHRKNVQKQINLPNSHWLFLLVTPICSYIVITYIMSFESATMKGLFLCCVAFLAINLSIFFLYDKIIEAALVQKDNELFMQKNNYYEKHLENMKVSVDSTRIMRHDIKNHMIVMAYLLDAKKYDELGEYFKNYYVNSFDALIDSGNTVIDSILNFKMQECRNKGIDLKTKIAIPATLQISSNIMVAVLGNLLSNAIEATEKLDHDRVVYCNLSFERGCLYLDVYNYYNEIKKEKDIFVTCKKDKERHGYGLSSVKDAVERNGGTFSIRTDQQMFIANVMLFNTAEEVL